MGQHDYHVTDPNRLLKNTLAVVLAGGRGTRLPYLTENESKPAVPFGGNFRLIDFPLSNCINSGVRRVAVVTQHKAHTLIKHVQRGWGFLRSEFGEYIEVWPAQPQTRDESWYSGTADAVFQNLSTIREHAPAHVLILGGDHVYKQDYGIMLAEHVARRADLTVACTEVPREEAASFGVIAADGEGRILDFQEKPEDPAAVPGDPHHAFVSMGVYVFSGECMHEQLKRDALMAESSHDFGRDVLPFMVPRHRVMAHRFDESCVRGPGTREAYWRDVGTLDAYWKANLDLTSVTPALDLYDTEWPIWTYEPQRPAAKFLFDEGNRRGTATNSVVAAGCVVSGATVRRCLLFRDVRVNSYALVEDSVVLPGAEIGRSCRIKKAIIGADCRVPEGTVVGEDPARDAKLFHRTDSGVTVVSAAMATGGAR
ncbi:MAG TPA: glucose-1-phosphate adenylyltransferase [Planctomycetes bacterium]|nr:glucose-1-phosphate adenylyltransferase [Planctomycetota bacterium]